MAKQIGKPKLSTLSPEIIPLIKKFWENELDFFLLLSLKEGPKSGSQLIKEHSKEFFFPVSRNRVYNQLHALKDNGLIRKEERRGREILYSLNPKTRKNMPSLEDQYIRALKQYIEFVKTGKIPNRPD